LNQTAVADQPITEQPTRLVLNLSYKIAAPKRQAQNRPPARNHVEVEQESTYSLPDEQSKVFPEDVLLEFAQNRYPELAKVLADPQLPESTRKNITQVIHDKLNGDIYIQKLKDEQGEEAEEIEEADEPTAEADPVQLQEHWNQAVNQFVDRVTDPKVAQDLYGQFHQSIRHQRTRSSARWPSPRRSVARR
jgi:hypothetical protein